MLGTTNRNTGEAGNQGNGIDAEIGDCLKNMGDGMVEH